MPRVFPYLSILLAVSACSGGNDPGQASGRQSPVAAGAIAATNFSIEYGRHYPNGQAAVDYLIGPEGMWKELTSLEYVWNYYEHCADAEKPYDRRALIEAADGARFFTAPDANCNLLDDLNGDGQLDPSIGGYAFHEHNGRGMDGQQLATPFTNFWFDDNWLARFVTEAYGHAAPNGLREAESVRWRILAGGGGPEPFYRDVHFDQLALDGLRHLSRGDVTQALAQWTRIRDRSGYFNDGTTRGFAYPLIDENYHLGLFGILTAVLMDRAELSAIRRDELLQHWVAVRANLLHNQERDGTRLLGWRSSISNAGSLMNTETISLGVLGLGAGALEVFEAGRAPLRMDDHGYVRGETYVSARTDVAKPGYLTTGPNQAYPPGAYEVQFVLRATGGEGGGRAGRSGRHADRSRARQKRGVAIRTAGRGSVGQRGLAFRLDRIPELAFLSHVLEWSGRHGRGSGARSTSIGVDVMATGSPDE